MSRSSIVEASSEPEAFRLDAVDEVDYGLVHVDETFDGRDSAEVVLQLQRQHPEVVAIGPDVELDWALALAGALEARAPEIGVVLIAEPTADTLARAIRAGAKDVISPDTEDRVLIETFDRARSRAGTSAPSAAGRSESGCRVIVVVSPKGGSGKTMLATNLALAIARFHPDQAVLVDLDLQFGDVGCSLGLHPEYTVAHAVSGNPNATTLKGFLTPHAGDLLCLCAPESPEEADDISDSAAVTLLEKLKESFQWLVVDTGPGLGDITLAAMEVADELVFVSATDVASVNATRKEIDIVERLGTFDDRSVSFVLNRADARVGLDPTDIASVIGIEPTGRIPSSGAIPLSMNYGEPIVIGDPTSAPARAIFELAGTVTGEVGISPTGRRFLRRFKR